MIYDDVMGCSVMKRILILTTVSGFLDKFEKGNLEILQEMGYNVHYAANMNEQHYLFDKDKLREQGVWLHHIDIARSPFMLNYNIRAFFQLMSIIRRYDIQAVHCHTPVGGMLGRLMGIKFWRRGLKVIYTAHGFHWVLPERSGQICLQIQGSKGRCAKNRRDTGRNSGICWTV